MSKKNQGKRGMPTAISDSEPVSPPAPETAPEETTQAAPPREFAIDAAEANTAEANTGAAQRVDQSETQTGEPVHQEPAADPVESQRVDQSETQIDGLGHAGDELNQTDDGPGAIDHGKDEDDAGDEPAAAVVAPAPADVPPAEPVLTPLQEALAALEIVRGQTEAAVEAYKAAVNAKAEGERALAKAVGEAHNHKRKSEQLLNQAMEAVRILRSQEAGA